MNVSSYTSTASTGFWTTDGSVQVRVCILKYWISSSSKFPCRIHVQIWNFALPSSIQFRLQISLEFQVSIDDHMLMTVAWQSAELERNRSVVSDSCELEMCPGWNCYSASLLSFCCHLFGFEPRQSIPSCNSSSSFCTLISAFGSRRLALLAPHHCAHFYDSGVYVEALVRRSS